MNAPARSQGLPSLATQEWAQRLWSLVPAGLPALAPKVISALLALLVAWEAARFTWILLPQPNAPSSFVPVTNVAPISNGPAVNVQQIADAHLFGIATAATDNSDLANAPQTNMTLVLSGTIASNDPAKGFAFVGESAAAAKFVKVGDTIAGAARLHSVFTDRVILDRGGRLEALLLPRNAGLGLAMRQPVANAPVNVPGQFAQNLKRIAETNPSAFSEIVRVQPMYAGGALKGFRVYPGRNRTQFAKLGFQPGDLVTNVNGTALDDPARANEIFNTLATSDRVTVAVERNGQSQQLNLNTAQIHLPDAADHAPPPPPVPTSETPETL
ncbi:MAG: type II secretion system protein GspC [Candidatus Obscuribacterales bacterium]|nr:type II secretion system protein GspC [Steroidobacteraceae bacterium]